MMLRRIRGMQPYNADGQWTRGPAQGSRLGAAFHPSKHFIHAQGGMHGGRCLWVKRPFDTLVSALGLLGSLPLWIFIAVSIKLDDGGPVFYSQERVGKGGRRFRSHQFRSMIPEADQRFGPLQAGEHDQRVTHVGRLLRATAMDELPQLWNILLGDMSFVGPRPLLSEEAEVQVRSPLHQAPELLA